MKTNPEYNDLIIVKFQAENIMGLQAVEIVPPDDVVTITGENGAGKSDVLNAISMVFGGAAASPPMPVKTGSTRGKIRVEVLGKAGGLVFEKRYKSSASPELVVTPDGQEPLNRPQEIADRFWNAMSDPIKFIRLGDTPEGRRRQAEIIRQIVKIDFTELDKRRSEAYDERKAENAKAKQAEIKLNAIRFEPGTPDKEVSVAELMAKLNEIQQKNAAAGEARQKLHQMKILVDRESEEIATISEDIQNLEKMLKERKAKLKGMQTKLLSSMDAYESEKEKVSAIEFIDEAPVKSQIASADDINLKVRSNRRRKELEAELTAADKASEKLTREIEEIDAKKVRMLSEAPFPVKGLAFDDSGLTYNGVPFCQVNTAKQVQIATEVVIALDPPLKVVLIRAGNDLGENIMAEVKRVAKERGYQLWIEELETEDPAAIVIRDGLTA